MGNSTNPQLVDRFHHGVLDRSSPEVERLGRLHRSRLTDGAVIS